MGMVHRRRCQSLPCVRGGGTVLCTVTEGLQIPAEARTSTCQSLSQPCGCQLPLHKGAEGAGRTYTAPPGALETGATFPPHPAGRACRLLLKEKASPCGDAKIPSEAGLAPSGSPAAQIYGMMHHFLLEEKALKNRRAGHFGWRAGCVFGCVIPQGLPPGPRPVRQQRRWPH